MKRIMLYSLSLFSLLIIFIGCGPNSTQKKITLESLLCNNAISICELKKAHFEQKLSQLRQTYQDDPCIDSQLYKELVELYEAQIQDIPCFLEGGPNKDNTLVSKCCDGNDTDCEDEDCKVILILFDCVVSHVALDNLVINTAKDETIEYDTKDFTRLDSGFLVYRINYDSRDDGERINLSFKEKNKKESYSVNFVYKK